MANKLAAAFIFRSILALVAISVAHIIVPVSPAGAQTVSVQNGRERGHGWMFAQDGGCYLILPRHLAEPVGRMRVRTAAPVAEGTAFGSTPFWPEIDLAVATVDDALRPRCTGNLDDLDVPGFLRDARAAQLEQLSAAGEIERTPLSIGDRTYLTFEGTVPQGARVAEGTSGAFAFSQGRPIGMAITSDGDRLAQFIRAGEIRIHIARWLEEHGRRFDAVIDQPNGPDPVNEADLAISFVSASAPPVEPDFAGTNMTEADGVFVADPRGGLTLLFRLGDGVSAVPLSQVIIESPTEAGFTMPRNLLIEFSAREDGLSMRTVARGQMGLDGRYASAPQAARNARWLQIRILSAWDTGPVAIDRVRVR